MYLGCWPGVDIGLSTVAQDRDIGVGMVSLLSWHLSFSARVFSRPDVTMKRNSSVHIREDSWIGAWVTDDLVGDSSSSPGVNHPSNNPTTITKEPSKASPKELSKACSK